MLLHKQHLALKNKRGRVDQRLPRQLGRLRVPYAIRVVVVIIQVWVQCLNIASSVTLKRFVLSSYKGIQEHRLDSILQAIP